MTYTIIEPPDDLFSSNARSVWTEHLERLEQMHRADPQDLGVRASLDLAKATLDRIRRQSVPPN